MNIFLKKSFFVTSFILLVLSQASADDVNLYKIVVTPSRIEEDSADIARSVDVISAKDIERSQAKDLSGLLSELASVEIDNYGGIGAVKTIKMRGSTGSQVLVLVDGRPINSPRDGGVDLSMIPLDNVERVEVMRGAGSSLYGAGAMGGAVNIITKSPPKDKPETELSSSFGTFRTYNESLLHGSRFKNFAYLITGGYQSSAGFRTNTEFNSKDVDTKFEYDFSESSILTLNSGYYKSRAGAPGTIFSPDNDDKQVVNKNFQDLSWKYGPDGGVGVVIRGYQNYDRLEFIENTAGSMFDTAGKKDYHTTKVRGYDLQFDKELLKDYQLICGFNYVTNLNDSTSSAKHEYTVRAGYLENKLDIFDRLKISLGARLDDYSNFGTEINPSISLLYSPKDNFKIRGAVNRSFRAPTFNDLYWPDEGWARGNPTLMPERGLTREIGIQAQISQYIDFDLGYYRSDYNDLINWMEEAGVWQPKNVNSAVIEGVELKNTLKLTQGWSLDTGYTLLRAKDKDSHKFLIYQPQNKADFSLRYNDVKGLLCELKGQFTDTRFHDAENTIKVKRLFIFGLNVSKKLNRNLTCFGSIENFLNRKYEVVRGYPMPGFSINGGLKLKF